MDDMGLLRDSTYRSAGKGLFYDDFNAAAQAIGARFPGAVTSSGRVNRSALAWLVWPNAQKEPVVQVVRDLAAMVMPWRDAACGAGWGQDDVHDHMNFTHIIARELAAMSRCAPPPHKALTMSVAQLEETVRSCFALKRFQYASESVPVFQLALFLKSFPPSTTVRWSFLRFEDLYAGRRTDCDCSLSEGVFALHSRESSCARRDPSSDLARRERLASSRAPARQYRNHTMAPSFDRIKLERAFAPWYDALLRLVARTSKESKVVPIGMDSLA